MFFGYILRENRSALELLSADYTFVDERLAKHYGIPGVYGPQFRRVKLTDPNRRGLLGQGSILVDDFRRDQNLTGFPREVRAEHLPQHAAASSAAECPHAGRKQQGSGGGSEDSARAAGIAPQEPALCGLPSRDRSGGVCARELRFRGEVARHRPRWRAARRGGHARGRNARSTVRWRCGRPF